MLVDDLIKKGHSKELAQRALKKNENTSVEVADKWIKENKEWLDQSVATDRERKEEKDKLQQQILSEQAEAVEKMKILSGGEIAMDGDAAKNEWDLAKRWAQFDDATLQNMTSGGSGDNATTLNTFSFGGGSTNYDFSTQVDEYDNVDPTSADKEWYNDMVYQPTHEILFNVIATEHALRIHCCRRALLSLFMNVSFGDSDLLTPRELEKVLHVALSLRPHAAAALDPMDAIKPTDITGRLVDLLKIETNGFYRDTLMSSAQNLLRQVYNSTVLSDMEAQESNIKRQSCPVHGRSSRGGFGYHQQTFDEESGVTAQKFEWAGAKKLKVIVTPDPTLTSMGNTYVAIYGDVGKTKLIARFMVAPFDLQKHVQVVEGHEFYYTITSTNWYNGCPPSNCIFTIVDISSDFKISEEEVLKGTVYSSLVFVNAMLLANVISLDVILLQLLRCLEFATDRKAAQSLARVATCIFNQWKSLQHEEIAEESDECDVEVHISEGISKLETAHENLRTWTLTQWSSGSLPGPHIQTLLELLLAARSVFKQDEEADTGTLSGESQVVAIPETVHDAYTKYRDGPSKTSMISLMYERVMKTNTLSTQHDTHNRYFVDDFVADVCVRGGKWYFEVKIVGQCQYACVGVVNRKYRKRSNSGIGNDTMGDTWCVTGPNTQFMHRGRNVQPVVKDTNFVRPNWSGGVVVGCKLDLEEKTIEFSFDGLSSGVAFSGVECGEGLYPCVSVNQQSQCVINLGDHDFVHPPDPNEGFCAVEYKGITSNSWLKRYQTASDVTMLLTHRVALPDNIVDSALATEASLEYSHKMRFEVVKSNASSQFDEALGALGGSGQADRVLQDNNLQLHSIRPNNTNITFKVSGFEPVEFVLRSVAIRCSSSTNGVRAMVFVGNTDPDFDSFDWCKTFTADQFQRFEAGKRHNRESVRKPHEPVGFAETESSYVHIKLNPPIHGKYLTLKLVGSAANTASFGGGMAIEFVSFDCIHGSHPLANLIGSEEAHVQRRKIITELKQVIQKRCDTWSLPMDEGLTEMSQIIATRLGVDVPTLDSVMLDPNKDDLARFKQLNLVQTPELQGRFSVIKYLNKLVTPLLHYIDVTLFTEAESGTSSYSSFANSFLTTVNATEAAQTSQTSGGGGPLQSALAVDHSPQSVSSSLSSQIHTLKGCYFMSTKKAVFDTLLAGSSSHNSRNPPRVTVNRIKAARAKENKSDPNGLKSIFGQLFAQLRNTRYSQLRGGRGAQLWSVQFAGEGSIDVGGPYRESLTNSVSDLQSDATPLFILCPNGRNSVGLNREKWIPNPSKTKSVHLAMYEFVGVLMGIALRTKQTLGFDLPSIVWKQLLEGEKVDLTDLEAIDKLCVQALNEMEKIDEKIFNYTVYETFTTQMSDGTEIELIENGASIDVKKSNYQQFVNLVVKKRLTEACVQIKSIRKGLNAIVPVRMLSLFNWYDLEVLICGNPNIDVEALRRHTVYQSGLSNSSAVVKYFWQTLYSFSQTERQLFLRFVWGRNRLPPTESDWSNHHFTIKALNTGEDSLPIAHTCFFSIDLPPYSSFELCRDKLRFAIHNCQAIDVDFNPNSSSLQAWVDY